MKALLSHCCLERRGDGSCYVVRGERKDVALRIETEAVLYFKASRALRRGHVAPPVPPPRLVGADVTQQWGWGPLDHILTNKRPQGGGHTDAAILVEGGGGGKVGGGASVCCASSSPPPPKSK